jgi:hypothetical protein
VTVATLKRYSIKKSQSSRLKELPANRPEFLIQLSVRTEIGSLFHMARLQTKNECAVGQESDERYVKRESEVSDRPVFCRLDKMSLENLLF